MTSHVVIAGAGPAGCAAAIALATGGVRVTIVEPAVFPRHRPGESLHPGVEPILQKLGVDEAVNAAGFHRHSGCMNGWNGEPRFEPFGNDEAGPWLGYQAQRSRFDAILLQAAERLGATVVPDRVRRVHCQRNGHLSTRAVIHSDTHEWTADWVLDGSGATAVVARGHGVNVTRHSGPLTAHYGYVDHSATPRRYPDPLLQRDGKRWTWIAEVHESLCAWVTVQPGQTPPDDCPIELRGCPVIQPVRGCDVTWRIRDRLAAPGWMLLGDAAAVLDPASSHGVLRGLMSGMQAAHLLLTHWQQGIPVDDITQSYDAWLRDWFGRDVSRLRQLYGSSQTGEEVTVTPAAI
ncbi:MAG: tryptophan 7-halogenase [Planctomycetaceae bacterium]|nr:tryptophan 7-halogenase [Planctomycetaceae bacterium]